MGGGLGLAPGRPPPRPGAPRGEAHQWRLGVHAAVCLAREHFGCPGLAMLDFELDADGVVSIALERALDGMDGPDGAGGMVWDADGKFSRFLARCGADHAWMAAAAAIYTVYSRMRAGDAPFGRSEILEAVCLGCPGIARAYLSRVYTEMFSLLQDRGAH